MLALIVSALLTQTEPSPPAELTAPPQLEAPPPAVPPVPEAFYREVLSWDLQGKQAVKGRERAPLERAEFFREVGRLDLIEKSDGLRIRRVVLAVSAGAVLVAGGIASAILFSTVGDLNSAYCVDSARNFNDVCEPSYRAHQVGGAAALAGGLVASALLATFAWWSDPAAIEPDEATHLVSQYNASLLKRVRAEPGTLRWIPAISPDGVQLAVTGHF